MWFTGFMTIIMGIATTCDIILRTFFNSPVRWAYDLNCYLCAVVAFLAGGYAHLVNRHVKVDIVYNYFPPRMRGIVDACTSVFLYLLCLVLVWIGSLTVIDSFKSGSFTGSGLNFPLYLLQLVVPLGGLLLGLQGIVRFAQDIKLAMTGKEGDK